MISSKNAVQLNRIVTDMIEEAAELASAKKYDGYDGDEEDGAK